MGWFQDLGVTLSGAYTSFIGLFPENIQRIVNLFLLILLVFIYAILIWKFYRFIARKNIISLNLSQYNTADHPVLSKFLGVLLYLVEYILILPFLVFLWFAVFTVFLVLLTEGLEVGHIIVVSAVVVGAIRLLAYVPRYGQELAKEVSKLLPFTLLGLSMTKPAFFVGADIIETTFTQIGAIPSYFGDIILFFLFIMFLEIFLRFFDFLLSLMGFKDPEPEEEE